MKQRSRLDLLVSAINQWLEQPKASRSKVTAEIVQAVEDCGLTDQLNNEGITFNRSDDLYNDMRVNAQKIFRWLGQYEGTHAFPDRLFYLEQAILAAMPEQHRLGYLNEVYDMTGVLVCARQQGAEAIDTHRMAASLTKEHMEAQVSVIELGPRPDLHSAQTAHREVAEAVATGTAVLDELEKTFPELTGKRKAADGQEPIQRLREAG